LALRRKHKSLIENARIKALSYPTSETKARIKKGITAPRQEMLLHGFHPNFIRAEMQHCFLMLRS
jgi:hypothetical protein